jgi:uncharacterized protein (TIGR02246 family)
MTARPLRAGALATLAAILVAGFLFSLACSRRNDGTWSAEPDPADLQAIRHLRDDFVQAENGRDVKRLTDLFTEDAVYVPADDATCEGRREIADYLRDLLSQGPATLKFEVLETRIHGNWAFERIDATLTTVDTGTGEPGEEWDRYFWILERQKDGSWKISRLITNVDESEDEDAGPDFQPRT